MATQQPQDAAKRGGVYARLYEGLGYLGGLILAVMTAAVFIQVIMRFLGSGAFDGLDEIPRYLFVWLVFIGAAAAMYRGEHTVLDYFVKKMPRRLQLVTTAITTLIMVGMFVWLIHLSLVLVPNSQLQTSAGLDLPLGYVYAAVPVGAVLILLPLLRSLRDIARELWPKRS
jgi:TRAP-type C4-dicarboxylate transport system permease small subunit